MKTRVVLIFSVLALLAMVGCKKEKPQQTIPDQEIPDQGNSTYVNVAVKLDSPGNYAGSRADNNATDSEQKINKLQVYIFGGGVLEATGEIMLNAGNVGTSYFMATTGPKEVYAVANPRPDMILLVGSTLRAFKETAVAALPSDISLQGDFVMVGSTEVELHKQNESEALNNPILVTLSRATAKVQLRFNQATAIISSAMAGTFTEPAYCVAQTNGVMFLPRKGYELTPKGADIYQVDANGDGTFDHLSGVNWSTSIGAGVDWSARNGALYFSENVNENPCAGNTSFVVLSLKYTPDVSVIKGSDKTIVGGTFYSVKVGAAINIYANRAEADAYAGSTAGAVVKAHQGGYCYYRINLRDIRKVGSKTEIYSVLRNSFYKINITEIKAIGGNTPTDPDVVKPIDPEAPLEENSFISTTVLIEPWDAIEIDEPLDM